VSENFSGLIELARGLPEVEAIITDAFRSEVPLLSEIPRYLFQLGGKRIRPVLALLVGRMCGLQEPSTGLLNIAAGIELIHLATLLHDDIIDKSPLRRKQRSAFLEFGLESSLLAGDFLLTRAFGLCARLDQTVIRATEEACVALTEGEILEVSLDKNPQQTLAQSLTIASKKTAALFNLACFAGSHVAGVKAEVSAKLAQSGEQMGIAFQILDDILDVTADENLLGKKSGMDLIERKPSVVNVLWLQSGSALAKKLTQPPIAAAEGAIKKESEGKETTEKESTEQALFVQQALFVKQALLELRCGPVIEQATTLAKDAANKSKSLLLEAAKEIPNLDNAALAGLTAIIDLTVSRIS